MSQRIHDPTEAGLPEYTTTGTLREILEELKEPPLYSSTPVRSPDDAVWLMAEMLKGYDREVFCIVNFRNDMTPIN